MAILSTIRLSLAALACTMIMAVPAESSGIHPVSVTVTGVTTGPSAVSGILFEVPVEVISIKCTDNYCLLNGEPFPNGGKFKLKFKDCEDGYCKKIKWEK